MEEFIEKLVDIFVDATCIDKKDVNSKVDLFKDLLIDDLDYVEFICEVEDVFDIEIPDDELFTTIESLAHYIYEKN